MTATPENRTRRKILVSIPAIASILLACGAISLTACQSPPPKLGMNTTPEEALSEAAALPQGSAKRDLLIAKTLGTLAELPPAERGEITVRWRGRDGYEPLDFDGFYSAKSLKRRSWKRAWHTVSGKGSPLVLNRQPGKSLFHGSIGTAQPATATLDRSPTSFEITLHDSFGRPSQEAPGIARNYSATLSYMLGRATLMPKSMAVLKSSRYMDKLKLAVSDPFDPDKIPVVFVHGLNSNAEVWVDMYNTLQADPQFRANYQIWFYSYPTGLPILYSALRLRQDLTKMREHFDPMHSNPNLDRTVLVGHSMGGVISRLTVSSTNKQLLAEAIGPLEELDLTEEEKKLAREALIFKAHPDVARAVFIAAPHRGSDVAAKNIVHRLSRLIKQPRMLVTLMGDVAQGRSAITGQKIKPRWNGVENLDPDSVLNRTMGDQPVDPDIPYHSIIAIGEGGKAMPQAEWNDGLVKHSSAHLDGARSEYLVEDVHNTYGNPLTIAEVKRILELHLKSL